jgi:ADP-ribose pyrophosphatase YjhB (NUDIX family)
VTTIGVFASIFDTAGRALCIRQNYGERYWTTPGGRLERAEAPAEGLLREAREEIGAEIVIDGLIGVYANPYKDDLILCFAARLLSPLPAWQPHAEIDALDFFPIDRLPQPMTANTEWRLRDGSAGRRGLYRVFDGPDRLRPDLLAD